MFEGTDDIDMDNTWVRFSRPAADPDSRVPGLLGRVFNGIGEPRDRRPPIVDGEARGINGSA